jgi:hypothetical protein
MTDPASDKIREVYQRLGRLEQQARRNEWIMFALVGAVGTLAWKLLY